MMYKILLIGPLPISGDVVGGAKVAFKHLVSLLSPEADLEVFNISRPLLKQNKLKRIYLNLTMLISLSLYLFKNGRKFDLVLLNISATALLTCGTVIWFISKIVGFKVVLRVFGGNLDRQLDAKPKIARKLISLTSLKFNQVLLETQGLVDKYERLGNVAWYPNTRKFSRSKDFIKEPCRHFIFLGHLRIDKGIEHIVEAAQFLDNDITITLCGSPIPNYSIVLTDLPNNIKVIQPISPSEVNEFLEQFDAMLFPSYYEGEGYPGAVIEALQCGLPVIATRWRAIPEVVQDDENGILIEPKSTEDLVKAIKRISSDNNLFWRLQEGALNRGKIFSDNSALERINSIIEYVCANKAKN